LAEKRGEHPGTVYVDLYQRPPECCDVCPTSCYDYDKKRYHPRDGDADDDPARDVEFITEENSPIKEEDR
jgi:hypothetical protein